MPNRNNMDSITMINRVKSNCPMYFLEWSIFNERPQWADSADKSAQPLVPLLSVHITPFVAVPICLPVCPSMTFFALAVSIVLILSA